MDDVARAAGVSRALVSIVMRGVPGASEQSRDKIRDAAERLGFRPDQRARLLGSSRSRTLGVVYGLHHEFHAELVDRIYVAAERRGYDVLLSGTGPSRPEWKAVQSLVGYRVEALVMLGPVLPTAQIERVADRVPVVVVARSLRSSLVDRVRTDDAAGARLAVEHLTSLGHERIVLVDGGRAPGAAQRRQGYRAGMEAAGLKRSSRFVNGGPTDGDGEQAARAILQLDRSPTAVLAFNDHCALGLLTALRAAGVRVPEDLSVVGFDDTPVAGLASISLTTVAQDSATLADRAAELAVARAQGPVPRRTDFVVAPRLVVRSTTAHVAG